ncbi:MAG TPA: DUF308 domain-containing protein [Coleofasciculaceae cyanobacterium]
MMESSINQTQDLRGRWGWLLALGIAAILLGVIAITMSSLTTMITVGTLGLLLMLGGVVMLLHSFETRGWRGFLMNLIVGLLYSFTGFFLFVNPAAGALMLTLLLAAVFVVGGFVRCIVAASKRFEHWGVFFASGVVSIVLGSLIWAQWPVSGLFIIGLFVGIDLLMTGWSLLMVALRVRHLTPQAL